MKFYLEPQPAVYQKRFSEDCQLCMAGGITPDESELHIDDLRSAVKELMGSYKRIYEINPVESVKGSPELNPSYISLACQLFPVSVRADRRSADDDRIPVWLKPLIDTSIEKSFKVIIAETRGPVWESIKESCGLNTSCVFMSRLEDSFNPDDQKMYLEALISMALKYAVFPKMSYQKTSGHINNESVIITGEAAEIVFKESETKPDYYL